MIQIVFDMARPPEVGVNILVTCGALGGHVRNKAAN
jgi:hypothetical protein